MGIRLFSAMATILLTVHGTAPRASAVVNLVLAPATQNVAAGTPVDVGLLAVSDDDTDNVFTALDVVLSWDPTLLELREVLDNGSHSWNFMFGLLPDPGDGLNDSLLDGDALFQAASFSQATATAEGILIATFRFTAVADTPLTSIVIEPMRGEHSESRVLRPGAVNVTGSLGTANVTITSEASLSVEDWALPAGRTAKVIVSGAVAGASTFGVEIILEIVSRTGNQGTVTFTESPPADIIQAGDPWPNDGIFSAFDADSLGFSVTLNASVDGDGSFVGASTTYAGPLSSFPVTVSNNARGVWDFRLSTSVNDSSSQWKNLATALHHGTVTIVDLDDGNGDGFIDIGDFAEFQVCYTGDVGPIVPPAYPLAPALRCIVYDMDNDGDIDTDDYAAYEEVMFGPIP